MMPICWGGAYVQMTTRCSGQREWWWSTLFLFPFARGPVFTPLSEAFWAFIYGASRTTTGQLTIHEIVIAGPSPSAAHPRRSLSSRLHPPLLSLPVPYVRRSVGGRRQDGQVGSVTRRIHPGVRYVSLALFLGIRLQVVRNTAAMEQIAPRAGPGLGRHREPRSARPARLSGPRPSRRGIRTNTDLACRWVRSLCLPACLPAQDRGGSGPVQPSSPPGGR